MKALRNYIDKVKPNFMPGGKYEKLRSTFGGFETFLFTPNTTNQPGGVHVRDAVDLKRNIIVVVLALIPALLFGMYNTGYQHYHMTGETATFWETFGYGFLTVLPLLIVTYVVGLGIEFSVAQMRGEEINEGFLATGMLIPLIVPADVPLWMVAVATAFSVIFAKEVFGGTGMNIWNPALIARAFLFFAYPSKMSGDSVWYGAGEAVDGFTGATALSLAGSGNYETYSFNDAFLGFIPGSIGETSALAILIGAVLLLCTGVASWKTMCSVFVGGAVTAFLFNQFGPDIECLNPETGKMEINAVGAMAHLPWMQHLVIGGFCFGAVFMATDPVTSCRTETGKYIFGLLIGAMAIIIRVLNPGYPEGMMLAILLMNTFAPLIDHFIVGRNIAMRKNRVKANK
ncbi:MAG: NADH:ubiquinone reductase (Na(+)-transporting) subunit B [Bacteroidales bacterium]|nr:NADH:ubiquinone reductase (Na(+)-transporting) subunit B [Bacteroidales bacterium]